ncbi:hypothetical protein H5410_027496 [Solanum commersonii]|uniref:Uncharacterized protein n=1 Tax=Solanum commersonii TaxID=4109 RepID=A0A9J5Z3J0_SOLCO|nr:hypothetical protein H5410_027496 [Solanum commersonii]
MLDCRSWTKTFHPPTVEFENSNSIYCKHVSSNIFVGLPKYRLAVELVLDTAAGPKTLLFTHLTDITPWASAFKTSNRDEGGSKNVERMTVAQPAVDTNRVFGQPIKRVLKFSSRNWKSALVSLPVKIGKPKYFLKRVPSEL